MSSGVPDRTSRTRGVLFLMSAALAWSFGGLWIISSPLPPMAVAGARSGIAALAILVYMRLRGLLPIKDYRQHIPGAIAYAGTVILFVLATRTTTAANAILLQYTAPIWVALFSRRLLGETVTRADWITVVILMLGMGVFFLDAVSTEHLIGNIIGVMSGVFFAGCAMLLRRNRHASPITTVLFGNLLAALIGIPFMIGHAVTGVDIQMLLLLGIIQLGLGYIFYVEGVKRASALESILIPMLEPVLNPIWVVIFSSTHQRPSTVAMIGGVIVITTVTLQSLYNIRKGKP